MGNVGRLAASGYGRIVYDKSKNIHLYHNNNIYTRLRLNDTTMIWRCRNYETKQCPVCVTTGSHTVGRTLVYVNETLEHNHPAACKFVKQ